MEINNNYNIWESIKMEAPILTPLELIHKKLWKYCDLCGEISNIKICNIRHSPSFDWHEADPFDKPSFFFCCEEHKKIWKQNSRDLDKRNIPYLAELDESMNYCEFFTRIKWNEGIYKRDNFQWEVNWLWDYKSKICRWYKEFKEAYIKHFWDFNRFKIHSRYNM